MSRILSTIGILLTFTYLGSLWWLFDGRLEEIQVMAPNNMGDFLAGIFGPLAILWLILGFFQQGIELRQNTKVLDLQAQELRNSVEQQRSLVEVSRKQMEAEIEAIRFERERQAIAARPLFVFHGVGAMFSGGKATYSSAVKNLGNTSTDVTFTFEPTIATSSITKVFSWSHGEERRLEWSFNTAQAEELCKLSISYIDSAGIPGGQAFVLTPIKGDQYSMVEIVGLAS